MHAHTGGHWYRCRTRQTRWLVKGNLEEMPPKVIQTTTTAGLFLWVCPCVYPNMLFFLLINSWLVSLLSVFVGILFLQRQRARALSLTTGLVVRIWCSYHHDPASVSGQFQATVIWGHLRSDGLSHSKNLQHKGLASLNNNKWERKQNEKENIKERKKEGGRKRKKKKKQKK